MLNREKYRLRDTANGVLFTGQCVRTETTSALLIHRLIWKPPVWTLAIRRMNTSLLALQQDSSTPIYGFTRHTIYITILNRDILSYRL